MRPALRARWLPWLVGSSLLLAPGAAAARGCRERSEIVGQQRCSGFGVGWDVSGLLPWVLGVGITTAHFPVTGARFTGSVMETQGRTVPFRLRGDGLGTWTSIAPTLRLAIFPVRVFYAGVEGQAGPALTPPSHPTLTLDAPGKPVALPSALAVYQNLASLRSLGAVAGVSVPMWRFDISAEVLTGFRALSPGLDWVHPEAAIPAGGGCRGTGRDTFCPSAQAGWTFLPHVEPRAGLALRLQPWVTLRALVGFDPLAGGAVSAGALLEIHTRAYDGFYPRRLAASR